MSQFIVNEPIEIQFFDHGKSLLTTIKNSSNRRSQSALLFVFRKFRNILLYRLAYFCPLNSWRIKMHRWRGVNIGQGVYIAQEVVIDNAYPEYIYIENNVSVNQRSILLSHTNIMKHFKGIVTPSVNPVVLKKGSFIGIGSIILPGVTIGENAIVSAGSVVNKNVSSYTMVIGNPAKKLVNFEHMFVNQNEV